MPEKTPLPILKDIQEYLASHDIKPYRFGQIVCGNNCLVSHLEKGGNIMATTEQKIREYMEKNP